jgi:type IV pilus biogenesis protein CpaD/CtpE
MKRLLIAVVALVLLAGCASEDRISITTKPIEIDIARTADPSAVQMLPVNFRVVTRDTVDTFISDLARSQGQSPVFIAITTKDYENLALNLADLRRYIEQQRSIIEYYRQMTSRSKGSTPTTGN